MPDTNSGNEEMTKLGVSCRCHQPGIVVPDEELVKLADGSMQCPCCGQMYLFRDKKAEECSGEKA